MGPVWTQEEFAEGPGFREPVPLLPILPLVPDEELPARVPEREAERDHRERDDGAARATTSACTGVRLHTRVVGHTSWYGAAVRTVKPSGCQRPRRSELAAPIRERY